MYSMDNSCVSELTGLAQAYLTPKGYHSKTPFLSSALFTSLLATLNELQLVKALAFRPKHHTGQPVSYGGPLFQ